MYFLSILIMQYSTKNIRPETVSRGVLAMRHLLIIMIAALLAFAGCVKKPKAVAIEQKPPPQVADTTKHDSTDVFNEFYKDVKEPADKGQKKTAKTFSMNSTESYSPSFSGHGNYVVQVASMGSHWLADELATEFKEKGYPAYVTEISNPTPSLPGTYYRVRIGGFSTFTDAKTFGEMILQPANYSYWVDLKSNESSSTTSDNYSGPSPAYTAPAPAPSTSTYTPPATDNEGSAAGTTVKPSWKSDTTAKW
jgi:hypothetical protein